MNNRASTIVAGICGVAVVLWGLAWYFSPRIFASSVATAAATGDLGTLVKRMDVERIRVAAADDLTDVALTSFKLPDGKTLSDALRSAITLGVKALNGNDDPALVDKVASLIVGKGFVGRSVHSLIPKEALARRTGEWSGEYGDTHDIFFHRVRFLETGEELSLMFERREVFTWRLVAIKTNGGSVLLPIRTPKAS